jgi:hypothetical protein
MCSENYTTWFVDLSVDVLTHYSGSTGYWVAYKHSFYEGLKIRRRFGVKISEKPIFITSFSLFSAIWIDEVTWDLYPVQRCSKLYTH